MRDHHVALGHVAGPVDDARVEDHHVVAARRGLARRGVRERLGALVRRCGTAAPGCGRDASSSPGPEGPSAMKDDV